MKSKHLLLLMLLALFAPWAAKAQETADFNDGTTTNSYVPFYGLYADYGAKGQFIIPATDLADKGITSGAEISKLTFYSNATSSGTCFGASRVVEVGEVTNTTFSSAAFVTSGLTTVLSGSPNTLTINSNGTMEVSFSSNYSYEGGNLLISIGGYGSSCKSTSWFGVSKTNAAVYGYNSSNSATIPSSATLASFAPKITITYTPGTPSATPKPTNLIVSNITGEGAVVSWNAPANATPQGYLYSYKKATDATYPAESPTTSTSVTISGLSSLTTYDFYVKADYGTTGQSDPLETSFSTTAVAEAVGDSWSDDFEGTSCGWELINGTQTNQWVWSTATNNGGTHALYISNSPTTTPPPYYYNNSGAERVYATKLLTFVDSKYTFSFDWKCQGESSTYDYLSVGLLPATVQLTADNTNDGTLPTGWIAVHDQQYLLGQTTWQTAPDKTIQVTAGNYYLVLRWRQDGSGGSTTPAAVDNVSITRITCDYDVTNLEVAENPAPTAHTATINWSGDAPQWEVAWSTSNSFPAASTNTQTVSATTINLENLLASSTYYVRVRAYCGGTDYGEWSSTIDFDTQCEAITTFPWEEKFENHAAGDFSAPCWSNTITSGSYKFKVTTSSNGSNSTHQLYAYSTNNNIALLVLPEMTIPSGKTYQFIVDLYRSSSYANYDDGIRVFVNNTDNLTGATELGFLYRYYNKTDGGVVSAETTYGWYTYAFDIPFDGTCYVILQGEGKGGGNTYVDNLVVRQAPDCATPTGLAKTANSETPEGATITWTAGDATSWIVEYKKSTEENYTAIANPVNEPTYTFLGLDASTTYNVRVKVNCTLGDGVTFPTDPISFTTAQGCPAPKNLVVTGITANQAVLTWTPGYNETEWTVKYKKNGTTDYTTAPTVSGTPTITLDNLEDHTAYDVQIYGCNEANVYTVTNAFATAYGVPFEEKFATTSIPSNWKNRIGLLSDIQSGGILTDGSQWSFGTSSGVFDSHAKINIYGSSSSERKGWLITPNIMVGSGNSLSFDLALTAYSGTAQPAATDGTDDKFIVLVSTDNGSNWSILRQWDNAGSDYVYNDIATNGESVYIDLDGFSNQTLCIAFYGESTVTNADNYLHIDNVSIDATPTCYRPGIPAASNVTNHSATLTWTAGEEGQTAWQIAYKKGETFNPNAAGFDLSTVITVDVDALTYTFDKTLDAASTYYVYVRANCDSEYSKWCSNACSFTTKTELPAPTSLTVANVMPNSLDLGWTVGGGDFEESWDIIYATTSTTPAADATPNFAGVTQNPYPVTGLENNTTYYFWVRANHTGHGTSAWSSYKSQKTPEACPKPTALTAGDPTPNSIKLSWTAGAAWQTAWTIAYSETDNFDPTDETACRYVEADTNVFVVDGLDDDKTYYFRVKGNCGSEYGESAWNTNQASAKTLVACPKPTNLAANNLTLTTADLTWTGYSDSYTVQIREGIPTYLSEDFEGGSMPEGWSRTGNYWNVGSGTGNTSYTGAANGNYNATCYISTGNSTSDILITPAMDLSSAHEATLSFNYRNVAWGSDINQFHVYYRVNNGEWQQLYENLAAQSSWTTTPITIALVGLADKYQIGFECKTGSGSTAYGYGMGIDDVKVYEASATPGEWEDATTEATNGAYTLTGLTKGTTYDVQIKGNCEGGEFSDIYTFSTPMSMVYTKDITGYGEGDGNWYLIASPLADDVDPTIVGMITDELGETATSETSTYDLYRFDQTQSDEWLNYRKTSFNLANGTGYLYANKNDVTLTFAGLPYEGNSKVVTLSNDPGENTTTHLAGYNLVGNPFTVNAYIGDRDFYVMNNGTEIILADRVAEGAAEYIEPMEGIFVIATENNEQLTFTTTAPESKGASLALNVNKNRGVVDRAMVRFSEGRTLPKFQLRNNSTKVYIPQDNIDYAVVSAEAMGELPVNFRANENGSYTLSFSSEEVSFSYLHLVDNMTGNDVDLLQTPSYTFDALTTDYESRFKLVFATGNAADDSFAFYSNGNWIINNDGQATLQVIDVTGRILSSETVNGSVSTTINAAPGVYMLRLVNGDNVKVQKVVVR